VRASTKVQKGFGSAAVTEASIGAEEKEMKV
jgi:hypothetical protein